MDFRRNAIEITHCRGLLTNAFMTSLLPHHALITKMKEKRAVTQLEMLLFKRRENISMCKPEKRQETKFHL